MGERAQSTWDQKRTNPELWHAAACRQAIDTEPVNGVVPQNDVWRVRRDDAE